MKSLYECFNKYLKEAEETSKYVVYDYDRTTSHIRENGREFNSVKTAINYFKKQLKNLSDNRYITVLDPDGTSILTAHKVSADDISFSGNKEYLDMLDKEKLDEADSQENLMGDVKVIAICNAFSARTGMNYKIKGNSALYDDGTIVKFILNDDDQVEYYFINKQGDNSQTALVNDWSILDTVTDDRELEEAAPETGTDYTIRYWVDEEARDEGFSETYPIKADTLEEAIAKTKEFFYDQECASCELEAFGDEGTVYFGCYPDEIVNFSAGETVKGEEETIEESEKRVYKYEDFNTLEDALAEIKKVKGPDYKYFTKEEWDAISPEDFKTCNWYIKDIVDNVLNESEDEMVRLWVNDRFFWEGKKSEVDENLILDVAQQASDEFGRNFDADEVDIRPVESDEDLEETESEGVEESHHSNDLENKLNLKVGDEIEFYSTGYKENGKFSSKPNILIKTKVKKIYDNGDVACKDPQGIKDFDYISQDEIISVNGKRLNEADGDDNERPWLKDKKIYKDFKNFVDGQLRDGDIDDPEYVETLSPKEYEDLLVNTWMKDKDMLDMYEEYYIEPGEEGNFGDDDTMDKDELKESDSSRLNVDEIAKFLEDSVNTLQTTNYTCCRYILDDELAIFVGWTDGADEEDPDYIHAPESPSWVIVAGIKERADALWTDYDYLNFPVISNGDAKGMVADNEITISPNENYKQDAEFFVDAYKEVTEALETGDLVYSRDYEG